MTRRHAFQTPGGVNVEVETLPNGSRVYRPFVVPWSMAAALRDVGVANPWRHDRQTAQ
jgi:hypothetical protein